MPRLIDTHCHLHFPAYDTDRNAVLERMREQHVWGITVGTNATTSASGIAFAEQHPDIFATVGYHPEHLTSSYADEQEAHDDSPYAIKRISEIARSSTKVVAIGETGLDFFRVDADRDKQEAEQIQERALVEHIQLAHELNLPLVVHCREAFTRLAEVFQRERVNGFNVRGVIHCFTGTWDEAKPLLDLGLFLSFTGIITFPPKKTDNPERSIHRTIERMPVDRLLVETDAPWLTPIPYRGKRNEPTYVAYVAETVAKLRDVETHVIEMQTTKNAIELFRLPT